MAIDPLGICGNQSASQSSTFSKDVEGLLSDIRVATPKTSNFYVASTTQVSSENTTVYAIAQCVQNTSQTFCQDCLNMARNTLYSCLPNTEAAFIDVGCFVRYSDAPFFNINQTTDISNFLKGETSSFNLFQLVITTVITFRSASTKIFILLSNMVGRSSNKVPVIAAALGCVGLFFLVLTLTLLYCRWKKSTKTKKGDRRYV